MSRERECDRAMTEGRRARAEQFAQAASFVEELRDGEDDLAEALVTLWVHAGIAAADVVCCIRLATAISPFRRTPCAVPSVPSTHSSRTALRATDRGGRVRPVRVSS